MKQVTTADCGCVLSTDGSDFAFQACTEEVCLISEAIWDTGEGDDRGLYYRLLDVLEGVV